MVMMAIVMTQTVIQNERMERLKENEKGESYTAELRVCECLISRL